MASATGIIGTAFNCSGATTPWNTVLSGEENFQATSPPPANAFFVGVTEAVDRNGCRQATWTAPPARSSASSARSTAGWSRPHLARREQEAHWLGRFRHENAAIRCMAGRRLVLYMGD